MAAFRRLRLESRMYNERFRQPESPLSGMMRPGRCRCDTQARTTRDVPTFDLAGESPSRRNCDGSPRGEQGNIAQNGCASGRCGGWGIEGHPLAMVYSPCQAWRDAYAPEVALERGTLFSELDLPFEPSGCKRGCM